MASHAYVQGASEALVLHDRGRILLYARFVVILPAEGQQAPFHIFPAALADKAGMDPCGKSRGHTTSHTGGLQEDLTLPPDRVLAWHTFPTRCSYPTARLSAAGCFGLQLQIEKQVIIVMISGQGKIRRKTTIDNPY